MWRDNLAVTLKNEADNHVPVSILDMREHRAQCHLTNLIEERNGGIKRRHDRVGTVPTQEATLRPVGLQRTERATRDVSRTLHRAH